MPDLSSRLRPGLRVWVANGDHVLAGVFLRPLHDATGFAVVRLDGEGDPVEYTFHARRIMLCIEDALNQR